MDLITIMLFNLTLSTFTKAGMRQETVLVLECPTEAQVKHITQFSVPGFRVYIDCEPVRGTRM